ncbi:MAG TPA: RNA polymerase sigma factor WhiG [Firmicutes bacterium]|nr:RNA polymerase sigma factor WhiG [Bacillota bacterium]
MSQGREERLWREFTESKSETAREALILEYAPLVKYVAGRIAIGLPPNVEFDDLVSSGIFGLMDAIDKFDPERGIKFETYAIARIRGSILDSLRSNDWIPRSVRQKAKDLERVTLELENRLGRYATDQEISEALHITLPEFYQMLSEVSCTTLGSLDELWITRKPDDDNVRVLDLVENEGSSDPEIQVEIEELKSALFQAIDNLSERERMVITLYYYEGLTLKEIGKILEISESRVSQIHTKAIFRLQGRLSRWRSAAAIF